MRGQKYTGGIKDNIKVFGIACISCGCELGSSAKICKCKCHTVRRQIVEMKELNPKWKAVMDYLKEGA